MCRSKRRSPTEPNWSPCTSRSDDGRVDPRIKSGDGHDDCCGTGSPMIPGEILTQPGDIELNAGLPRTTLTVANTGDGAIQVGSHYHFAETNPALSDRKSTRL